MSRVDEIAKILGCTHSNVCYLLRRGRIKGKRTSAGWVVSSDAVREYINTPKTRPYRVKHKLHKGQRFGYWTVLDPEAGKNRNQVRTALVECICGKRKYVSILDLVYGHSRSCGCRRAETYTKQQQEGRDIGHEIMDQIHQAGLAPRYVGRQINRNNRSGHTGVCWRKNVKKYYAYIMVNHKQIPLGMYTKLEDAIAARKAGEEKYFKEKQEKVDAIKNRVKQRK